MCATGGIVGDPPYLDFRSYSLLLEASPTRSIALSRFTFS
jgi:hypothetical protein